MGVTVHGFLHQPKEDSVAALVLTHGAGSNANSPVLIALAESLAMNCVTVFRIDLPFRQLRPKGPPSPSGAAKDQEGLRAAVGLLRKLVPGKVMMGGQSYGGRQATMLAASDASACDGLLLLSYPLHPPGKPNKPRTAHFPRLQTPAVFVQGSSDPFGSVSEMHDALALIPAPHLHVVIEGAGHDLRPGRKAPNQEPLAETIRQAFQEFFHLEQQPC